MIAGSRGNLPDNATLLRRTLETNLIIFLTVGGSILLAVLYMSVFITKQVDVSLFFVGVGLLLFFIYKENMGYQIAWDQDKIYQRDNGFRNVLFQRRPYFAIDFDDIASVESRFQGLEGVKSKFMPFQYLEVASHSGATKDIWIHPESLKRDDLVPLLQHIEEKCPGMLPNSVRQKSSGDSILISETATP